jgi:hypothetical protein
MADTKISALPASTTPLAGTEVLPIVQSGVTRQVSVANLTAGRAVSVASLTASTGNIVIGTSGQGIDFSATPGTGTSELFSDYEEGTFTANLTALTTGPTTPISVTARYTKVGRVVTVQFNFSNVNTTGASGELTVTNLPYVSGLGSFGSCFMISNGSAVATLFIQPSSSQIFFLDAVTGAYISISAGAGKYYGGTITYTV